MGESSNVKLVEIYRDEGKGFSWRALGGNGEIVAEGESHTREGDAGRAAQGVFGKNVVIRRAARGTVTT